MKETSVRTGKVATLVTGIAVMVLLAGALPTLAQEREEFPQPGSELPLDGYTRTDGIIVLSDEAFCRYLLGSLWSGSELTFTDLIDTSKKQKKARGAAFEPASDANTLERCAEVIGAFRVEPPTDDTLAAWARRSPVVPEALAGLLPDDFEARPLAQPDEIGAAARTSGFGDTVSAPFEMDAETWLAEVDAVGCSEWTGTLRNARDATDTIALTGIREYLYNVDPGHYYWEVSAPACDWSVDLVPIGLGPDPDATPVPRVPVPRLFGEGWNAGRINPDFLNAAEARQALLDAGLTVGECVEAPFEVEGQGAIDPGRVWGQEPAPGTLVELGAPVDVFIVSDCDIVRGDRVLLE
jgi:hypothetical protein